MSYLKLIRQDIQKIVDTVGSILSIDVAVADRKLTRVAGTSNFHEKLDKDCSDDSIFAKVIETGDYIINLNNGSKCDFCSYAENCREYSNMSYPIKVEGEIIGVISFASFTLEQSKIFKLKKDKYLNMLVETSSIIEREVENTKFKNKIDNSFIEVNDIINSLNKGIVILDKNKEIISINSKALGILNLNLKDVKIIGTNIEKFISGIEYEETMNIENIGIWKINNNNHKVMYNINKISIKNEDFSIMISFDTIDDIVNIAKTYGTKRIAKFENIIGESNALLNAVNKSKVAANTDSTILIKGDSGTGKELFARSIHNESNRKNGPFIAINCGSIPENLIESELFGYEEGSFTGAKLGGKKGKIELAHNGTLFLDEIGDLPLYLQTRLLRVLQEREVDRIGSSKPRSVNIRIISASNKDLLELVRKGEFRLDLYYRLNVIPITLPTLRERDKDVIIISEYIINTLCDKMNIPLKYLSKEVEKEFLKYPWYGNIRELENVLEHGICFAKEDEIKLEDLPEYFIKRNFPVNHNVLGINKEEFDIEEKTLDELNQEFELMIINRLIETYGEDTKAKKRIAEKLGIGLTTLYRKIEHLS